MYNFPTVVDWKSVYDIFWTKTNNLRISDTFMNLTIFSNQMEIVEENRCYFFPGYTILIPQSRLTTVSCT